MSDAIFVEIADAVATSLDAASFDYGDIGTVSAVYESKDPDGDLEQESINVRVIMPQKVHNYTKFDRGRLRTIVACDIDVRFQFGAASQGGSAPAVPDAALRSLSKLVDDIHRHFFDNAPRIGTNNDIEWIDEDDEVSGVDSRILFAYHSHYLRNQRLYYGCCREFFRTAR